MDIDKIRKAGLPKSNYACWFTSTPALNKWGPRVIADYEFVYVVEGIARYRDKNNDFKIGVNEMLLIPPKRLHTIWCDEIPSTVHACAHFYHSKEVMGAKPCKFILKKDTEVLPLLRKCANEYKQHLLGRRAIMDSIIFEILIHLCRQEQKIRLDRFPYKSTRRSCLWNEIFKRRSPVRPSRIT